MGNAFVIPQPLCWSPGQLRSLCTTQERVFSGSSSIVRSWTCLQAIWPHLIAFEECCRARFARSRSSQGGREAADGGPPGGILPAEECNCFPEVSNFIIYIFYCLLIFVSDLVFLLLRISGFLSGVAEFSAHFSKCFVSWHFEEVCQ